MALGLAGFAVSAAQVYGNKLLGRGVARGLLYRFVRHPQYLALGVAGWGLLTLWPRFLLLGLWVTMLFLYAGLARHEERRMAERFGDAYRRFAVMGAPRSAWMVSSPAWTPCFSHVVAIRRSASVALSLSATIQPTT